MNKVDKVIKTIEVYQKYPELSMIELAKKTDFSKSSINRYLNEKTIIEDLYGKSLYIEIKNRLNESRLKGNSLGGQNK
jgi:predicted DNA-binding transcriptional regulator YafY